MDIDRPGIAVSPLLYGIFFEEVSRSGDGGLYAEMIQNRSFEDMAIPVAWTLVKTGEAEGTMTLDRSLSLNVRNPTALKLQVTKANGGRVGVVNDGFKGVMAGRAWNRHRPETEQELAQHLLNFQKAAQPGTYYSATASPGDIVKHQGNFIMFFSGSTSGKETKRTLGIARAEKLDGPWVVSPDPIVPLAEQIENSSLYYEPKIKTWFLFTNHIGINDRNEEFTDAVWVYWSKDLNRWDTKNKAVVLDGKNCSWSKNCIGMPTVMKQGNRLALFYDAPGAESVSHMKRDIGLAWLDLPLTIPLSTPR